MKKSAIWVMLLILCVVFCACGKDATANKTPSVSQTPEQQNTLPTFTKESTESINGNLGNSIANYSNLKGQIVECKDYIFHCYTENCQIVVTEKSTGLSTLLPIYGYNLSLYNNVLYYKALDRDNIFAYDLVSGKVYSPVLPPKPKDTFSYSQFFVTEYGFVIVYDELVKVQELCVADFDGNIISQKSIPNCYVHFVNEGLLAFFSNKSVITLSVPKLVENNIPCPEGFNDIAAFGDGYIYDLGKSDSESYAIKLNPLSAKWEKYLIYDLEYTYYLGFNNDILYYTSQDGTSMISTSGEHLGVFNSMFHISDLSFTTDGYVYGIAEYKSNSSSEDFDSFFVRLKSDGTELTALHY